MLTEETVRAYTAVLKEELVPAMGCTEPIAVAYAGALARETLGQAPDRVELAVSGNIIKNVKSVIVPHTGGRKGLKTAVSVGICCGDAGRELEVLSGVTEEGLGEMDAFLRRAEIAVRESDSGCPFDIAVTVEKGGDTAFVRIVGTHTNVVRVEKNGRTLVDRPFTVDPVQTDEKRERLNIRDIVEYADTVDLTLVRDTLKRQIDLNMDIVEYADTVDLALVRDTLKRQIDLNMDIVEAGLQGSYGAGIGKILIRSYGNSVQNRAKAYAAAGSDARMNGCEKPVVINSGSGNQGLTASVPVIVYAGECGVSEDMLLRALIVSNLVTVHLKAGIGSLSAYCGATSAGAGAGAGVCYLYGGRYDEIAHTVVNALAINSGMLCDGAKASCAAKIASAVEAGLLGWRMNVNDSEFVGGDGIVFKGVENTINAVSRLASHGMRAADDDIIGLMVDGV